jgi:hypothetical protein
MTLHHHRISPQMYRKTAGWAKSHHTVMQTKTKCMDVLVLTETVCHTRVTYIVTTAETRSYSTEELLMCTYKINWHVQFRDLRSSEMLCSADWQLVIDTSKLSVTSVTNYRSTLLNILEELRSHLLRSWNMQSHMSMSLHFSHTGVRWRSAHLAALQIGNKWEKNEPKFESALRNINE